MGCNTISLVLLTLGIYLLIQNKPCVASPEGRGSRSSQIQGQRGFNLMRMRAPEGQDIFDDDSIQEIKRQFDDYGHMRFGKRGGAEDKFDDYGHMRFGRSQT